MIKSAWLMALLAGGLAAAASSQAAHSVQQCDPSNAHCVPAIAFTSTRVGNGEIYLMVTNEDGTEIDTVNPIRVTENNVGDGFPQLSPDGKKIVFDSNRDIPGLPTHISDLFIMKSDGNDQTRLTRGSSATWSPDGKYIAFHRSASGSGLPIKVDPGAATTDSDIFVMRVRDLDADVIDESTMTNITNSPAHIDDDADWSPDGQKIVYTRHGVNDNHMNSTTAEICVLTLGGPSGTWSLDGSKIAFQRLLSFRQRHQPVASNHALSVSCTLPVPSALITQISKVFPPRMPHVGNEGPVRGPRRRPLLFAVVAKVALHPSCGL